MIDSLIQEAAVRGSWEGARLCQLSFICNVDLKSELAHACVQEGA